MKKSRTSPTPVVAPTSSTPASRRCSDTEPYTIAGGPNQRPVTTQKTTLPITVATPNVTLDPYQASTRQPNQVSDEQKRASRIQLEWTDAMCKNMKIPEGYAQVAVLIIKWDEHLDELNTRPEVEQLETLFQDELFYEVEIISLYKDNTDHKLHAAMSGFLARHDQPNNLLIVYYTGHSRYNNNIGDVEFCNSMAVDADFITWRSVERPLMQDVKADTLAILDTCFASNFTKGGAPSGRAYQVLAACGYDKFTARPGNKSFTAALMASLKQCLLSKTPFTVWFLMNKINDVDYRRDTPAFLYDRVGVCNRQILLAPLEKDKGRREKTEQQLNERSGTSDLILRFSLTQDDLTKEHIEKLTQQLPVLFKDTKLDLRRIELDGFEKRPPIHYLKMRGPSMAVYWGQQWLKRIRSNSEAAQHRRGQSDTSEMASRPLISLLPSSAEIDEETPDASVEASVKEAPRAVYTETSRFDYRLPNFRDQDPLIIMMVTLTMFNALVSIRSFLR